MHSLRCFQSFSFVAYNVRHHGIDKESWKFNGVAVHLGAHNNAKAGQHKKSLTPANHIVAPNLKGIIENQLKNLIGNGCDTLMTNKEPALVLRGNFAICLADDHH